MDLPKQATVKPWLKNVAIIMHNATAEKHGNIQHFFLTTSKVP